MIRFSLSVLAFVLPATAALCTSGCAAKWPYDPLYEPVSQKQVVRVFRNPNSTFDQRRAMLSRAGASGLLETVVVENSRQLKKNPRDPVLRGFYCYALFIAHDPADYKPQNKNEWLRQQNSLFTDAARDAEFMVKEPGATSFCWQALAYVNLGGVAGGIPKGIEYAEKALKLAPDDPFAHRLLASAYLRTDQTQNLAKVLAHARRAQALQPKAQSPCSYEAQALFRQKHYAAALSRLKKSYALRPPRLRDPNFMRTYESFAKAKPGA